MIKLYGCSDDLVEIEGDIVEEYGCPENGLLITLKHGDPDVTAGVQLRFFYDYKPLKIEQACWTIAITPIDEDAPIPWPIKVELNKYGYSPLIIIDCLKDDVRIETEKLK